MASFQPGLEEVITNASTLREILLTLPKLTDSMEDLALCKVKLRDWISHKVWSEEQLEIVQQDIIELTSSFHEHGEALVDVRVVSTLLYCPNFLVPITTPILHLLSLPFTTEESSPIQYLKPAIVSWLSRLIPVKHEPNEPTTSSTIQNTKNQNLFKEYFVNYSHWWIGVFHGLWEENSPFMKPLSEITQISIHNIFFREPLIDVLSIFPEICFLFSKLPPHYLNGLHTVYEALAASSKAENIFTCLRFQLNNEPHVWFLRVRMGMVYFTLNAMDAASSTGDADATILERFLSKDPSVTLSSLVRNNVEVWPMFIEWYGIFSVEVTKNDTLLSETDHKQWNRITVFYRMVKELMESAIALIQQSKATVDTFLKYHHMANPVVLDVLEQSFHIPLLSEIHKEIKYKATLLKKLVGIATTFFPATQISEMITHINGNWKRLSIEEIRTFFRTTEPLSVSSIPQLDPHLLSSLQWLYILQKSSLFMCIWEQQEQEGIERLVAASNTWQHLFHDIWKENISFSTLKIYIQHLLKEKEVSLLLQTARGYSPSPSLSWHIEPLHQDMKNEMIGKMNLWKHLYDTYHSLGNIQQVLASFAPFLTHTGKEKLKQSILSAKKMEEYYQDRKFGTLSLSSLREVEPLLAFLDVCLSTLDPNLFEHIPTSIRLLIWLRQLHDDNNFSSSLEEAMGKGEMECPVELWQGRVDEKKLSMLNTVRSYFYELIYRPAELIEYEELLTILRNLPKSDENTIQSLMISSDYMLPLMDLLGDSSHSTAPDRLLQLLHPSRNAHWICTNRKTNSEDINTFSLSLCWSIVRGNQVIDKSQNLAELSDFQSTLVLSTSQQLPKYTIKAIDTFIEQCSAMRGLQSNITLLHAAGHFEYQHKEVRFSITEKPSTIQEEVKRSSSLLLQWQEDITNIRKRFYFLNFFSTKQFWRLVDTLQSGGVDAKLTFMQDCLYLLNPDIAHSKEHVNTFLMSMESTWAKGYSTTIQNNYSDLIALCGEALSKAASPIPPRTRSITLPTVQAFASGAFVEKGFHMICADSPELVMDHILSIYARAGYMPEWELIHVCRATTSWEDISTLILRWATAHNHHRSKRIYCLARIEVLSFEVQRKAVLLIKDMSKSAVNPFLVISGSERQHMVAQFTSRNSKVFPLPEEILRDFSSAFQQEYSAGISLFLSKTPGLGKTFLIRTKARRKGARYIPIPILHENDLLTTLRATSQSTTPGERVLLHFDVYDQVDECCNPFLFDIVFLGGSRNSDSGEQFFWPPTTSLFFEIPAGPSLIQQLRIICLLPRQVMTWQAGMFRISQSALEVGMGQNQFSSTRYDGHSFLHHNNPTSNAYERLVYVCSGLQIMSKKGRFPYVPNASLDALQKCGDIKTNQLTGERCYTLLAEALEVSCTNVSLWCIWNFINVFYWQLRDMHAPDSPINTACMPLSDDEKERESRERVKGEVVHYLIRTAKEFATRQLKHINHDPVVGLFAEGMSRYNWNGYWQRMDFEKDGMPAFSRQTPFVGTFFMYFRKTDPCWVIDDIIEPEGPVYSTCKGNNCNGQWFTSPDWRDNPKVSVRKIKNKKGFQSEGVEVKGCVDDGGSLSTKENGIYIRQPPYDDINNHAHYILTLTNERRHLFWGENSGWQISPLCNNNEGAFCMSVTANMEGIWNYIPPDLKEDRTTIVFVRKSEETNFLLKPALSYQRAIPGSNLTLQVLDDIVPSSISLPEVEKENLTEFWESTLKWNDSNHECLLFSNETHTVSFLSLNPRELRSRMHPGLLSHLQQNRINVGEDLDVLSSHFYDILSALTGVSKSIEEANKILGGQYCLTGDNLLKMLAIFVRLRCGVPVVLMGECGCGKTMLIQYLCDWIGVKLRILDVHGGTSKESILALFQDATTWVQERNENIFVFMDEMNTCSHMGLICEIICHRTLLGVPLDDRIFVLSALNPYRIRKKERKMPGLVYQHKEKSGAYHSSNQMDKLVYRVHPIPHTLRDFLFDFGCLTPSMEKNYILSMVMSRLPEESIMAKELISGFIHCSQQYIRVVEEEISATSLRDVTRCIHLIVWFKETVLKQSGKKSKITPLACATVMGLAFVYSYRLHTNESRSEYWKQLSPDNAASGWQSPIISVEKGFEALRVDGSCEALLQEIQESFCDQVDIEAGIAMNTALKENLFVTIVCILNRIPIFIVGKPGSSKTLTMQVIASNLQGKQSAREFWRSYPAVYLFPYQCSPMSDSQSIQKQFDMATRYQEHAAHTITVLLLDEVGLAEHSPDMPLKVLHAMLVDPPISVVGLSNWTLDSAKMNRAICLQRTEPSTLDITLTGRRIIFSQSNTLNEWLQPLTEAYHEVYTQQQGRDFIGMRDYYNLVKLIMKRKPCNAPITKELLSYCIARNFGGKMELQERILKSAHQHCFGTHPPAKPLITTLIQSNLCDDSARHLMLLTKNNAALTILFGCHLLDPRTTTIITGSEFEEDKTEIHLITQINEIKMAMASGSTVVLLHHDNIYEALYDVLNQRYLYRVDHTGKTRKLLRLAIGSRSQLCHVAPGFKLIVIVEQTHAYDRLDLPLLNRFEKQVLCLDDILGSAHKELLFRLEAWTHDILAQSGLQRLSDVFCGFYDSTLASAVLTVSHYNDGMIPEHAFSTIQRWLFQVARPIAVINSPMLCSVDKSINYFEQHADLPTILHNFLFSSLSPLGATAICLTHSPFSHLDISLENIPCSKYNILQLAEINSAKQLHENFQTFFTSTAPHDTLLIIQCDPILCQLSRIHHARYISTLEREEYEHSIRTSSCAEGEKYERNIPTSSNKRHLLFLIHLPPGIKQRDRHFILDYNKGWDYLFVDDLRVNRPGIVLDTISMLSHSPYELVKTNQFPIHSIIQSKYQHALSCGIVPEIEGNTASSFGTRIRSLQSLLLLPEFTSLLYDCILDILEQYKEKIPIRREENRKGGGGKVFVHVNMVCQELVGSMRQSLHVALEIFIIQAFAHVLRWLDCNFNISTIWRKESAHALWFALSRCEHILRHDSISLQARMESQSMSIVPEAVPNSGHFGFLVSRFPFADKIIRILNDPSTREEILRLQADHQAALASLCHSIFGMEITSLWQTFGEDEHLDYLHDFVAIAVIPLPGLSFEKTFSVCRIALCLYRPDTLHSLPGIHVAAWMNEERIFRCCSILANSLLSSLLRDNLLQQLHRLPLPPLDADISHMACMYRMTSFDRSMLDGVLTGLWQELIPLPTRSLQYWLEEFSSIQHDIELYLISFQEVGQEGALHKFQKSYVGLRIMHIYIAEIAESHVQHDSLDRKQWENMVQSCLRNARMEKRYFLSLVRCVAREPCKDDFIRRYLFEIVFGEQEKFYCTGEAPSALPNDFCELCNQLLHASVPNCDALTSCCSSLPLRRLLLHCLLKQSKNEFSFQIALTSPEAKQLYLQHFIDMYSTYNMSQWEEIISKDPVSRFQELSSFSFDKPLELEILAQAQSLLRLYSHKLSEYLSQTDRKTLLSSLLSNKELQFLLASNPPFHHARVYCMKVLRYIGGVDGIGQAILSEEKVGWLEVDYSMTGDSTMALPDPFSWLHDDYGSLCAAVRSCATQSNRNTTQLDKMSAGGSRIDSKVLCAAIFSQTVLEKRSLFPEGIQALKEWVNISFPLASSFPSWLCSGAPNYDLFLDSSMGGLHFLQIGVHLAIWALRDEESWLYHLLFNPAIQNDSFLISVPDDPFMEIVNASGKVGWYICPNGHKYSVGQCAMPMERASCTQCGVPIGGMNHVSVRGVRKLDGEDLRGDPIQGYDIENNESTCVRLTTLSCRVLRFMLHNILLLCASFTPENASHVAQLLWSDDKSQRDLDKEPFQELAKRMKQDWTMLRKITNLPTGDLTLAMHSIIHSVREVSLEKSKVLESTGIRNKEEKKISLQIELVLVDRLLKEKIQAIRNELKVSGETSMIRLATGEALWFEVHEHHLRVNQIPDLPTLLWRYREPVSFHHFYHYCILCTSQLNEHFQTLQCFMKEEKRFSSICGIADILAWHRILFNVIPHMKISRIEAIDISNQDAIEKLPISQQEEAKLIFERFAHVFNTILPTIDLLFECQDNPFLSKDKQKVNLGNGRPMDSTASIAFSLPSVVTGTDRGDFINGICTIKILETLLDSQNEILASLETSRATKPSQSKKTGKMMSSSSHPLAPVQRKERPNIPAINYTTEPQVLAKQLIVYERKKHLLPLLCIFSQQSLSYGEGGMLSYDLHAIQSALSNSILVGKRPINLCIRHYQYSGDSKRMGHLEVLPFKMEQESLSSSILTAIGVELDTLDRLIRLKQQVEVCIAFIVSASHISVGNLHGDILLSDFVTKTLFIAVNEWKTIATPSIMKLVYLRHIQSLFLFLEEIMQGNPLDDVLEQYCNNMSGEESVELTTASNHLQCNVLLPIFRNFLINQLTTSAIDPSENLKEYLEYASGQTRTILLEEEEWWNQHFPSSLHLRCAKPAFLLLKSLTP